jgi:hypothetical protein
MDPTDLDTKPRFDADENGQSRQAQHQILISPVTRIAAGVSFNGVEHARRSRLQVHRSTCTTYYCAPTYNNSIIRSRHRIYSGRNL